MSGGELLLKNGGLTPVMNFASPGNPRGRVARSWNHGGGDCKGSSHKGGEKNSEGTKPAGKGSSTLRKISIGQLTFIEGKGHRRLDRRMFEIPRRTLQRDYKREKQLDDQNQKWV